MFKSIGGDRYVLFLHLLSLSIIKKSLFPAMGFCGYEDEHTNHTDCLNNSYYPNAYAALCCMGVCCNSPLLGRKGVRENEIF